jgi:hypothetical protein
MMYSMSYWHHRVAIRIFNRMGMLIIRKMIDYNESNLKVSFLFICSACFFIVINIQWGLLMDILTLYEKLISIVKIHVWIYILFSWQNEEKHIYDWKKSFLHYKSTNLWIFKFINNKDVK